MLRDLTGALLSDSSPAWSLLRWSLDLMLQGTLLLLLAGTVALLLGWASAALRHMVWMLTMGALLTLPLLSLLMPRHVALLPSAPVAQLVAQSAPSDNQGQAGSLDVSSPPSRPVAQSLDTTSTSPWVMSSQIGLCGGGLWLIGMLLVASRVVVGLQGIRLLESQSAPVVSGGLREQTHAAQQALGCKRAVIVRVAHVDAPISMPLTWGWRRPVVLLPADAEMWPPLRQQAVLLHEVAHVARGDWWMLLLSQVTCALFWFHPLVWRAARLMREESERATDDRVLAAGVRVTDYGECLLEFVRSLGATQRESTMKLTIGMARPSSMEQRIRALLESGRNRQGISRLHLMVGAAATALALFSMATLSVVDAAPRSNMASKAGAASKTYFIPSGSMEPTLPLGSRIPFQLNAYKNIAQVQRGDIIAYTRMDQATGKAVPFFKRVVGLPGDKVQLSGTRISLNGHTLSHGLLRLVSMRDASDPDRRHTLSHGLLRRRGKVAVYQEINAKASYAVQYGDNVDQAPAFSTVVPADQLLCLGDNRDNAYDSRYTGAVPFATIIGKKVP